MPKNLKNKQKISFFLLKFKIRWSFFFADATNMVYYFYANDLQISLATLKTYLIRLNKVFFVQLNNLASATIGSTETIRT